MLGVTGGIAAYKAAELARLFVKAGDRASTSCMTDAACALRHARSRSRRCPGARSSPTCGNRAPTTRWATSTLSRGADAIVVAPASADFLAKLAHGHADDLLSTLCLARDCPLLVAPAMNRQMWANAATQRNVAQLVADGVAILGPGHRRAQRAAKSAKAACSSRKSSSPRWSRRAQPKVLAGKRVLLTAGPTFEAIDPVRGITNSSSGKMGFALAQAAAEAGAEVTLVAGPTPLATPAGVTRVDVTSAARDGRRGDGARRRRATCSSRVAAVADYTPDAAHEQKLKKSGEPLTLTLKPTVDILATVAARPDAPFCVGFAAESHDVERNAEEKRKRKKLPLLVANRAQDALGSDDNEVTLLDDAGAHPLPRMDKLALARRLVAEIARRLPPRAAAANAHDGAHGTDRAQGSRRAHPPAPARLRDARIRRPGPARMHRRAARRSRRDKSSSFPPASRSTLPIPASPR